MESSISIHDFEFRKSGHGYYTVIFKSPQTGKSWSNVISDMTLIDATKNSDKPKIKDLEKLKKIVKNG